MKRSTFYTYIFSVFLSVITVGYLFYSSKIEVLDSINVHADTPQTYVVDLSNTDGVVGGIGLGTININSLTTEDSAEYALPLKFLRLGNQIPEEPQYDFIVNNGGKIQISPSYYLWTESHIPGDDEDWTVWENQLEEILTELSDSGFDTQNFEVEIWNEPNTDYFWPRSRTQFFETWKIGVLKVRQLESELGLGHLDIAGPSLDGYDGEWIESFLLYAKANDVLPDIMGWHMFDEDETLQRTLPSKLPDQVNEVKSFMVGNDIDIDRFQFNEYINDPIFYKPGPVTHYLAALENVDAYNSSRACWGEPGGFNNCSNHSLNGLLTDIRTSGSEEQKPRSTWWVYKYYSSIKGEKVVTPISSQIASIAGIDRSNETVSILIGANESLGEQQVVFRNVSSVFNRPKTINVTSYHIPNLNKNAVESLESRIEELTVVNNEIIIDLEGMGQDDAYFITLTMGDSLPSSSNGGGGSSSSGSSNYSYVNIDIDGNSIININDFLLFARYYKAINTIVDFNKDKVVNVKDYVIFTERYKNEMSQ